MLRIVVSILGAFLLQFREFELHFPSYIGCVRPHFGCVADALLSFRTSFPCHVFDTS